jgi:putative salt-induced outer membrane protein YdiY
MNPCGILLAILSTTGAEGAPSTAPRPPLQDPAPAPEYPHWTGALTLGATWTDGNTETATINGTFKAERRDEKDRWTFDLYGNYGETTDRATDVTDETTNNSGGAIKYDYFWSKKVYLLANGSGKVDHVADLDLRYVFGAGVGCQWQETEKVKWGTELGLSYVDEDFEDDTADADFVAARLASNLVYELSKSTSFEQVAEFLPSLEDSEDVIAKLDNRLKLNIVGKWIAQLQYVLDFDGSVPNGVEETDHRVVLGLGWGFGS